MSPLVKRLSWALSISLGLNVFMIGFESARWLSRRAHHTDDAGESFRPHRGGMHQILGRPTPKLRAQRELLRAARAEVGDALSRDPFDRAQMADALARLRELTHQGQALLHERLLERAATLPLEQRRAIARRLQRDRKGR